MEKLRKVRLSRLFALAVALMAVFISAGCGSKYDSTAMTLKAVADAIIVTEELSMGPGYPVNVLRYTQPLKAIKGKILGVPHDVSASKDGNAQIWTYQCVDGKIEIDVADGKCRAVRAVMSDGSVKPLVNTTQIK